MQQRQLAGQSQVEEEDQALHSSPVDDLRGVSDACPAGGHLGRGAGDDLDDVRRFELIPIKEPSMR